MSSMETQAAEPRGARQQRFPVWVAPVAAIAIVLVGAVFMLNRGSGDGAVSVSDVPEGVSARAIGGEPVFVVRDGDDVQVFAADPRHLPEDTLWWCPNERIFVGREHAESFSRDGLYLGGPARGGLNEYPSEVDGDNVVIDIENLVEGDRSEVAEAPPALVGADWSEPWDSGPGSFCDGAVAPRSD